MDKIFEAKFFGFLWGFTVMAILAFLIFLPSIKVTVYQNHTPEWTDWSEPECTKYEECPEGFKEQVLEVDGQWKVYCCDNRSGNATCFEHSFRPCIEQIKRRWRK